MIFKLQRAQFTSHEDGTNLVLAYNKDRSIMGEFPMGEDEIEAVFGDEQKVFINGKLREDGKILIDKPAKWQEW